MARLHARVGTLMVLQALRVVALLGSFAVWFVCVRQAAQADGDGADGCGAVSRTWWAISRW